jgi:N-hydroxyarylamine O-acetyltransferase
MDTAAYLERIGYQGSTSLDAQTLRALNRRHLLSVPFENLDIHLGNPIILNEQALFEKIVRRRRGGFCYELNGLFAALLRELGFRVALLNSLIPEKHNGWGGAFDHPILLVELDERWIVDVGFGDAYRVPLRLDEEGEQPGLHSQYRLAHAPDGRWEFRELENGEWDLYYAFTLRPARLEDFVDGCRHYETSPKSSFTQKWVCTRATPEGHISLTEEHLIITRGEQREERPLTGEADVAAALRDHFGIVLEGNLPRPRSRPSARDD